MKHNYKKVVPKVLFICKQRPSGYGMSYGLLNSCRFLCNALNSMGAEAVLVEVVDNNGIDREIHIHRPTHVFIEALWVVPEKFEVLIPLHPKIQWHVRIHSNTPFIANEGIAMDWLVKYGQLQKKYPQFHIAPNSHKMTNDLCKSLHISTVYAPNVYQLHKSACDLPHKTPLDKHPGVLDIGCFGAIRPLKNQLIQAMAAMAFADDIGQTLHLHMNHSRIENKGENTYKNIMALFNGSKHKIIMHEWLLHDDFLKLITMMDMGLQVSISETFNIVAADFAHMKVPIVGSHEIEWMSPLFQANPTDIDNILSHMWVAWIGKKVGLHTANTWGLEEYNNDSREVWRKMLEL